MSYRTCVCRFLIVIGSLCAAFVASAQVTVNISGNVVLAEISLPAGAPDPVEATLRLEFQQPQNLTVACLGISADLLDAATIAMLDARFPDPAGLEIDPDFALRVTVEPPPGCGLTFVNEVQFELTTVELVYGAFSPYRLLKAPLGGPFADVTAAIEEGSIRARGSGGTFSEFVIAEDLSQDYLPSAELLFSRLANEIDDPDIALSARTTLESELRVAEAAFRAGQFAASKQAVLQLDAELRAFSGMGVGNVFQAAGALPSEAGELLGLSGALAFQLSRLEGLP